MKYQNNGGFVSLLTIFLVVGAITAVTSATVYITTKNHVQTPAPVSEHMATSSNPEESEASESVSEKLRFGAPTSSEEVTEHEMKEDIEAAVSPVGEESSLDPSDSAENARDAFLKQREEQKKQESQYSEAECTEQKNDLLAEAEEDYVDWADAKAEARMEIIDDFCSDESSTEGQLRCEGALSEHNVKWQEKMNKTMDEYHAMLGACTPTNRSLGELSDVIPSNY